MLDRFNRQSLVNFRFSSQGSSFHTLTCTLYLCLGKKLFHPENKMTIYSSVPPVYESSCLFYLKSGYIFWLWSNISSEDPCNDYLASWLSCITLSKLGHMVHHAQAFSISKFEFSPSLLKKRFLDIFILSYSSLVPALLGLNFHGFLHCCNPVHASKAMWYVHFFLI